MFHNPYSHHHYEVPHPHAPYTGDIPNGLVPGKQIYISGVVQHHADQFRFDLETRTGGCAFVINPRFHAGQIVRNTDQYGNGGWGPEERSGPFIFQKGHQFDVIIEVKQHCYSVTINGTHAFDYAHRVPIQEVTRLSVKGEITIKRIVFSGGAAQGHEALNPTSPYIAPLHHGAQPGRMIQIQGQIPHHARRIEIDLQNGPGIQPPTIGFCFNIRFDDPMQGQAVVRVNRTNGAWGGEERDIPHFPFAKGSNFDMLILIEQHEVKVAVNGSHFIAFRLRNSLHELNHLCISGEVSLFAVRQY